MLALARLSSPTFEGPRSLAAEDLVTARNSRVTTPGQSPRWLLLTPPQRSSGMSVVCQGSRDLL